MAGLAVLSARLTVSVAHIEESVVGVARNFANSIDQDVVLVAFSAFFGAGTTALEAAAVAWETLTVEQVLSGLAFGAFAVRGSSAFNT